MTHAASKAAAELFSLTTFLYHCSAGILLRARPICTKAIEGVSAQPPWEHGHVSSSFIKAHGFHDARRVLDEIPTRSAPVWTTTISGCARAGRHADGMHAFREMLAEGVTAPNAFVLAGVLKCCAGLRDVESGKRVHGWMLRNNVHPDVVLCNAVLDMYAKCGDCERAKRAFGLMAERDAVSWNIVVSTCLQNSDVLGAMRLFDESPLRDSSSWNTVISGLMRNGYATDALARLHQMVRAGVMFNHYTYSTAFSLVGMLSLPNLGRQLHGRVVMAVLEDDAFVRCSLMDMYCKCSSMEAALLVFDHWSRFTGDVKFAWSTMVAGYAQNGREEDALEFFRRMLREGVVADQFILTSVAAACATTGMVEQGRQVHGLVEKLGHRLDAPLASAIIDMYSKCGSLADAERIFDRAQAKNVTLWTSMLCSYASYGQGRMAIQFFNRMKVEKVVPNEVTLVAVLSACSHNGLVNEGDHYFKLMQQEYGIVPSTEHYNCMVDLYARSGLLDRAVKFIEENNINHEAIVWKTLLSACRLHKNLEFAKLASEKLVQLEQCDSGSYVLLSNMYATNNRWVDTTHLRSSMRERKVRKQPGRSWIHTKGMVHTFVAGDTSHPRSAEIYAYLEKLMERLKEIGYTSRTDLVVHDVEVEQRETTLKFHSEKLAVVFGIISTPIGTPLRIFKNLRVCEDCHEAIKFISRAVDRDIVVRDLYRFHHFKGGFIAMGLFKGSFKFMLGMGCGVYVAQNYNVPNVKRLFNTYVFVAKHMEETYRKPKKDDD